jgi:hypothetical protein
LIPLRCHFILVTGADGGHRFLDLAPAEHIVEFRLPAGRSFTLSKSGGDVGRDSNADPTTGRTEAIVLAPGQIDDTWDAGVAGNPTSDDPTAEPGAELGAGRVFLPILGGSR